MTPDAYCEQKAAQSGSSFYYSFRFLPPDRRRAITALYAFCREVDDIADEVSDINIARAKLGWWRAELANAFDGHPSHPVTRALTPAIQQHQLRQTLLQEIIDGMEMDLTRHRYRSFEELELYCHRVAGVVGQLSAAIFGYRNPQTVEYAESLGRAFQLTNIIRDVGEDARRDRIYLPAEDLERFKVDAADILAARYVPGFRDLMAFQAARARDHYSRAFAALDQADRAAQRPGLIMAAIYQTLLEEIERDDYRVLHQRVSLTPLRKLWIAWRTWVTGG
ncbi:MAG TPA: presqualene diphosphate synthase HpnD [Usitatibacteraceae bacterium]|nr:presqualene diphosphate synthase HpnD [Usitatibacteraceae bacterium]